MCFSDYSAGVCGLRNRLDGRMSPSKSGNTYIKFGILLHHSTIMVLDDTSIVYLEKINFPKNPQECMALLTNDDLKLLATHQHCCCTTAAAEQQTLKTTVTVECTHVTCV